MKNLLSLAMALLLLPLAACASVKAEQSQKRIAITFDDIPRAPGAFLTTDERSRRLVAGLKAAGVKQAAFFINPANLEQPFGAGGEERIGAYVAAGHVLANHSFSHPRLSKESTADYLADIDRAEAWLKGRNGRRAWFRYPFLDEGQRDLAKREQVRAGLHARGLRNGYVTADGSDWNMETLTIDAVKAGKAIDMPALQSLYVETMVGAANFYDGLAQQAIGRSPAHVLLLHETDLAALFIGDLVTALRQDGWTIITADAAFSDPVAATLPSPPSAQGTLIEMLASEKGLPAPRWYERNNIRLANALFAERVLKEKPATPRN